jgi:hypothetical protein
MREEAHNEETERVEEIHNVGELEVMDEDADGWFKASPYGVFEGKTPGRPQHLTYADAKRMESHFNSLAGKLGRLFRGVPVFIGHPDVDRTIWTDERRLGKIVAVQARADGLWTKADWNKLGRENQENGYWIYPSTRWDGPAGQMEFHPDRLLSIGLTNNPRIKTSEPMANANFAQTIDDMRKENSGQDAADAAGVTDAEKTVQNKTPDTDSSQQQDNIMDRKILIEKLGLPPEATDEEILAKLDAVLKENAAAAAAEKAKLDAEAKKQGEVSKGGAEGEEEDDDEEDDEEDELKKARMETANARVDLAIAEGRITAAERDAWLPRLTGENRESEANALLALKPKFKTGSLDLQKARTEVGDEAQRRETIANAVAEYQGKGMSYSDASAAVRKDAKYKPIFDAMKEPGRED